MIAKVSAYGQRRRLTVMSNGHVPEKRIMIFWPSRFALQFLGDGGESLPTRPRKPHLGLLHAAAVSAHHLDEPLARRVLPHWHPRARRSPRLHGLPVSAWPGSDPRQQFDNQGAHCRPLIIVCRANRCNCQVDCIQPAPPDAFEPAGRFHSYGWKVKGKLAIGKTPETFRAAYERGGWRVVAA